MSKQLTQDCVYDDAPDWRWQRAQYERNKELKGDLDFVVSDDLVVKLAKRFLKVWEDPRFQGEVCRELIPGMAFVYDLHKETAPGCTRHALEAALIANARPQFIQSKIHKRLTPFIIRLYELLFYDVRDKLKSPFWIEKYIFAPAAAQRADAVLNSDLIWKVVAYSGGSERLLKDCLRGHTYENKDFDWVIQHTMSQNARDTLKYVHKSSKLPKELTVQAHQRTLGSWEDRALKLEDLTKNESKGGIPIEHASFRGHLKMKDADIKGQRIEKLDANIYKYADGDLDK